MLLSCRLLYNFADAVMQLVKEKSHADIRHLSHAPGFFSIVACNAPAPAPQAVATAAAPAVTAEKGGQEEFGPYELVENWPQPLPDGADGVKA
jgi:hypothetical protein